MFFRFLLAASLVLGSHYGYEQRVTGTGLPKRSWAAVTSGANGTNLTALVYGGYIYASTNSGATWTQARGVPPFQNWWSGAASADGTKVVAGVYGGPLYISKDAGLTWTARVLEWRRND